MINYVTKSSGEQDEFAGGGHRDKESGKPRFDLLRPLTVPYESQMLTRWAALMGRGAEHYGDRNWEQMADARALDRFRSSAARHFEQWLDGQNDEDHAAAVMFNITGAEYVKGIGLGNWPALNAATEPAVPIELEPFVKDRDGDVYRREPDGSYTRWCVRKGEWSLVAAWTFDQIRDGYGPVTRAEDPEAV